MQLVKKFYNQEVMFRHVQSAKLKNSLLQHIIYSKRVLADHIELLEQCQVIPIDSVEHLTRTESLQFLGVFTVFSTLAVFSLKTDSKCFQILGLSAAATYGVLMSAKAVFGVKNQITRSRIMQIISTINEADAAIRKSNSLFRELKTLAGHSNSYDRSGYCLELISEIIRNIYGEVKVLESVALPDYVESMYEPLEELSSSVYFQKNISEFTTDDIRMFYNIFLYFQSQYLTRLSLIIFYVRDYGLKYINTDMINLREQLCKNIDKLNINDSLLQLSSKSRSNVNRHKINDEEHSVDSTDVIKVKRSSMDILCRLSAITNQYENTDQRIQSLGIDINEEELLDIHSEMKRVYESISSCQNDINTLHLIYGKYIVMKVHSQIKATDDQQNAVELPTTYETISINKNERVEDESTEYFAMRDIMNDNSDSEVENEKLERTKWTDDLENIDLKMTRSFFAPVLKQLKTKIDPIKMEMKEREMKFLMSKGIDRDQIMAFDDNGEDEDQNYNTSSDSGSVSNERELVQRRNRFVEMRCLLQQKDQIGFLPLGTLPKPSCSEDILE